MIKKIVFYSIVSLTSVNVFASEDSMYSGNSGTSLRRTHPVFESQRKFIEDLKNYREDDTTIYLGLPSVYAYKIGKKPKTKVSATRAKVQEENFKKVEKRFQLNLSLKTTATKKKVIPTNPFELPNTKKPSTPLQKFYLIDPDDSDSSSEVMTTNTSSNRRERAENRNKTKQTNNMFNNNNEIDSEIERPSTINPIVIKIKLDKK